MTARRILDRLIDGWLGQAKEHGREPSWKMAARFWNGLIAADVSGPSFFDKAFGQDKDLRGAVDRVLEGSMMWRGLERISEGSILSAGP